MAWRRPRPVSSKVVGGVTGRGNCRTKSSEGATLSTAKGAVARTKALTGRTKDAH